MNIDASQLAMQLDERVELATRSCIRQTLDEFSPGWVYVPYDERDRIAKRLRRIASEIKRRDFLPDQMP